MEQHSYLKYESYKPANSAWLGEVPDHWRLEPGLAVLKENKDKNKGMVEEIVLSLSYGKVVVKPPEKLTGLVPESFETYQVIKPNDIIIRPTDLQNDHTSLRTGLAKDHGIITSAYICLRPLNSHSPTFLHYLLHAYDLMKVFYGMGSGLRQNLDYRDFKRLELCLPPKDEQDRIANFLDQKNAEIDEAIAKKKRLIELLKEQKAILINQAVTKGLRETELIETADPFFPAIPKSSTLVKLGHLCNKVADGPHFSPNYVDEGVMFISAGNIRSDGWLLDDAKKVSEKDYRHFCKRVVPEVGDVLYTKGGTTGVAKVVDIEERFQVWVHVAVLKLGKEKVHPSYLAYALNSAKCYEQSKLYTRGATNKDLGLTRMVNISLPLPSRADQEDIVSHLDEISYYTSELSGKVAQEILALEEYRSVMTSEAVTGKIKL